MADKPEEGVRGEAPIRIQELLLDVDDVDLPATLATPRHPRGLVIFAHVGSWSRLSARNLEIAQALQRGGAATLLLDLLTEQEAADMDARFDIALLARRLLATARWAAREALPSPVPLGYFGASTGAAAALVAAAQAPGLVAALVSCGGHPNLAHRSLSRVTTPTLFIVGERDQAVLHLNEQAAAQMETSRLITIVPGAGHLFEEPGALREAAQIATSWFVEHFPQTAGVGGQSSADRS